MTPGRWSTLFVAVAFPVAVLVRGGDARLAALAGGAALVGSGLGLVATRQLPEQWVVGDE